MLRDHLEGQLVVIPKEQAPLAGVWDRQCTSHNVYDRRPVLAPEGHEDSRHYREVEGHVALIAVAEVAAYVFRPLVGLRQEHSVAVALVHVAPYLLKVGMDL